MICQKAVEVSKINWYRNKGGSVLNCTYSNSKRRSNYSFFIYWVKWVLAIDYLYFHCLQEGMLSVKYKLLHVFNVKVAAHALIRIWNKRNKQKNNNCNTKLKPIFIAHFYILQKGHVLWIKSWHLFMFLVSVDIKDIDSVTMSCWRTND